MGAGLALLAVIGLAALAASGGSSRRRGAVTPQTRARVRDTLGTPDTAAAALPVEDPPASVDPDRRPSSSSSSSSSSGSGQSAWAASRTGSSSSSGADAPVPSGPAAGLTITPPPEDAGTEGSGDGAIEIPTTHDPDEARRLAAGTANAIRSSSSGWRNRLRAFQRAAGIPVDGRYGGLSYNALIYYGIRNPPAPRSAPRPSAAAANYVDRIIAPAGGATVSGARS